MRATDLLRELPVAPTTAIDRTSGSFEIAPLVNPLSVQPGSATPTGTELVVTAFANRVTPSFATVDQALATLSDLPVGTSVLILSADRASDWPIAATLDWATRAGAVVVGADALSYRWYRTGLIATIADPYPPAQALRNELVIRRMTQRSLDQRVRRAEHRSVLATREIDSLREVDADDQRRANELSRRLANAESQARAQADEIERLRLACDQMLIEADRARAIEESTTYQLGHLLRTSIKPSRRTLKLPRELAGLWRGRGAWKSATKHPATGGLASVAASLHPDARLMWAFRSLDEASADAPVAVVSSRAIARSAGRWGGVVALWPNDAADIFAGLDPTALLIESGAARPGEAWATLGQPMSAYLDERVRSIIDQCRRRDIPTIFWWTTSRSVAPGLERIAGLCDHVASDPGVPGAPSGVVLPVPVDPQSISPTGPANGPPVRLLHGRQPVAEGVEAAAIDAATTQGLLTFGDDAAGGCAAPSAGTAEAREAFGSARYVVASPFQSAPSGLLPTGTLRAIASGKPVVAGRGGVPGELAAHAVELLRIDDVDRVDEIIADESVATAAARSRAGLDVFWRTMTWPGSLADVFDACSIDATLLRRRLGYDVVAAPGTDPERLIQQVLAQSVAPHAVVTAEAALRSAIADELDACGIEVTIAGSNASRTVAIHPDSRWAPWHAAVALASLEATDASTLVTPDGLTIATRLDRAPDREVVAWWMTEEDPT